MAASLHAQCLIDPTLVHQPCSSAAAAANSHSLTHSHQTQQVRDEYSTSNDVYQPQAAQKGSGSTAGPVSSTAAAPSGTVAAGPSTAPPQSTTAKLIESMPEPADKYAWEQFEFLSVSPTSGACCHKRCIHMPKALVLHQSQRARSAHSHTGTQTKHPQHCHNIQLPLPLSHTWLTKSTKVPAHRCLLQGSKAGGQAGEGPRSAPEPESDLAHSHGGEQGVHPQRCSRETPAQQVAQTCMAPPVAQLSRGLWPSRVGCSCFQDDQPPPKQTIQTTKARPASGPGLPGIPHGAIAAWCLATSGELLLLATLGYLCRRLLQKKETRKGWTVKRAPSKWSQP